jgi:hypothetical protein
MITSKKSLTPTEVLQVTTGIEIYGIAQHHLAGIFGVDSGRVAEAVVAMRWAMENHRLIYRHIQKVNKAKRRQTPGEPEPLLRLIGEA